MKTIYIVLLIQVAISMINLAVAGRDFYKILEARKSATKNEIEKAHVKLAKELHPDKNKEDPGASTKFQDLGAAQFCSVFATPTVTTVVSSAPTGNATTIVSSLLPAAASATSVPAATGFARLTTATKTTDSSAMPPIALQLSYNLLGEHINNLTLELKELHAHMSSLQWIQQSTISIGNKLEDVTKIHETFKRYSERYFRSAYYN